MDLVGGKGGNQDFRPLTLTTTHKGRIRHKGAKNVNSDQRDGIGPSIISVFECDNLYKKITLFIFQMRCLPNRYIKGFAKLIQVIIEV